MDAVRVSLGRGPGIADALRAVRDGVRPFALVGRWAGSRAIVGSDPVEVVEGAAALDVLRDDGGAAEPGGAVGGGWFGYLGFGLGAAIERLPPPPPRPVPLPLASLGRYDHVLRLDADGEWWFEALPGTDAAAQRLEELRKRLHDPHEERAWRLHGLEPSPGATARHTAAVAACVQRIAAGELFQANLCLRLQGRFEGSAADAFLAAAHQLRPAHGAFVGLDDERAILSFSPELFLERAGDRVATSPIKGTAPRDGGAGPLLASAKDAAEHVMIVDLSRNDLGRVARYGSVRAYERRAEPHPGLWHLVSDVTAQLEDRTTDADVVRAAFPPGSVTGAPKVQALKVIADLEGTQREVYTGATGFASPLAGLHLNVAIRTLEIAGDRAWMGCGGGIVADSDPIAELEEALAKARPIAEALGARVAPARRGEGPPKLKGWPRRPDPAMGLLETIAVRGGEAVDLDRHLARLARSARALYGAELPAIAIPEIGSGRVRVLATPRERSMRVDIQVERAPAAGPPVILEPRAISGGLGAHKWLDRPHEPHHLAVDLDGSVLEAGFANVWVLDEDGVLTTPPADGRILPGLTRARLLAAPDVPTREAPIPLDRLGAAAAIVLTSSIRLATPAALHPGQPTKAARDLAARIRDHPAISNNPGSYIR